MTPSLMRFITEYLIIRKFETLIPVGQEKQFDIAQQKQQFPNDKDYYGEFSASVKLALASTIKSENLNF